MKIIFIPMLNVIQTVNYFNSNRLFEVEGSISRGCARGRIGTRFLRPRGTSPLKGAKPVGTLWYRNGTESFFGLKGHPSVVWDV
jgi:hypothetical protein